MKNSVRKSINVLKIISFAALVFIICLVTFGSVEEAYAKTPSRADALSEFYDDGVLYIVTKKPIGNVHGQIWVAGAEDSVKKMKISATVTHNRQKYDVVGVVDSAFWNKAGITLVELPATVKEIGECAFQSCTGLVEVTLPDNLTKIGEEAFQGCSDLKIVNVPSGLRKVPRAMFSDCTDLKAIKFNTNLTSIGEYAFANCSSLKIVLFPNKLKTIGNMAFNHCTSLKRVSFVSAKNLVKIGEYAFDYCTSITKLKLPMKLKTIGQFAFSSNESLKTVKLGNKLKTIGAGAFAYCPALTKVTNGISVVTIGNSAFEDDTCLESVKFGKKLTKIGDSAFSKTGLTSFNFTKKITSIGALAFSGTPLKTVKIPGNVQTIMDDAFSGCEQLTSVYMGKGVAKIGDSVFHYCYNLETIDIPATVHDIGLFAFESTKWLYEKLGMHEEGSGDSAYYTYYDPATGHDDLSKMPDSIMINDVCIWLNAMYKEMTEWGYETKRYKQVVEYPKGARLIVADIGLDDEVKKLVIPAGVRELRGHFNIGDYGDEVEISLPNTLKLFNCQMNGDRLKRITLPASVTQIGDGAFSGARNLSELKLTGKNLKRIGNGVITDTAVTSIELPESVTTIDNCAFMDSKLEKITLPEGIKYIGENAFANTKISELLLPRDFELVCPPTNAEKFTIIVYKDSKAEKSIDVFFSKWGGVDQWKVKRLRTH